MKYNYHELESEEHKWALIEAIVLDGKDHHDMIADADGNFEIELSINGERRDYMKMVDLMLGQLERMVEERAKEMLDERFADVSNVLYDLEQAIRAKHEIYRDFWDKD